MLIAGKMMEMYQKTENLGSKQTFAKTKDSSPALKKRSNVYFVGFILHLHRFRKFCTSTLPHKLRKNEEKSILFEIKPKVFCFVNANAHRYNY